MNTTKMTETLKVLYIIVIDVDNEENKNDSFRYTRSVLQSSLQLMGCKAHHTSKKIPRGSYFQEGAEVKMEMSVERAYRGQMKPWVTGSGGSKYKQDPGLLSHILLLFISEVVIGILEGPVTWRHCQRKSVPSGTWMHRKLVSDSLSEHLSKIHMTEMDVLNVTEMTMWRKDGCASLYYQGPKIGPLSTVGGRLVISSDGVWDTLSSEAAMNCCQGMSPAAATSQIVHEVVQFEGLRDDTTCIVIDILLPKELTPPVPPLKKHGKGVFKNMFRKKPSKLSLVDKDYSEPDVVEEIYEESAML
ncbi:hypothetical protein IFM89_021538 [Coptis chinensis]|uniref:PPM-type phosphatase domain-containing protein n=1 Tax=Coptis chinensis TaxID=261450 RepID=A0A835ID66_9MAGN|nr:hypothetical protein IFM89_021538 [Coptis chinensis]